MRHLRLQFVLPTRHQPSWDAPSQRTAIRLPYRAAAPPPLQTRRHSVLPRRACATSARSSPRPCAAKSRQSRHGQGGRQARPAVFRVLSSNAHDFVQLLQCGWFCSLHPRMDRQERGSWHAVLQLGQAEYRSADSPCGSRFSSAPACRLNVSTWPLVSSSRTSLNSDCQRPGQSALRRNVRQRRAAGNGASASLEGSRPARNLPSGGLGHRCPLHKRAPPPSDSSRLRSLPAMRCGRPGESKRSATCLGKPS